MAEVKLADFDTVFISYDEPNADQNYENLLKILPWAKRSHGVKGSDLAHKAAANLSETDRFISIDGDNIVNADFFDQTLEINDNNSHCVFSWSSQNSINGLIYGNGGIKCWPKSHVLSMKTHENSQTDIGIGVIEFCFDPAYVQINDCWSTSVINTSPKQAWRSGFREGVKMSLDQTKKASTVKNIWWQNYERLLIWMNVGSDVENGIWAMYGARLGCYLTTCTDWDHVMVRDFDYLDVHWTNTLLEVTQENIEFKTHELGLKLKEHHGLEIANLDSDSSKFFKRVYRNMPRTFKTHV